MLILKIVGLFKTIMIIIAVMVIIRFITRIMATKATNDHINKINRENQRSAQEKAQKEKHLGKTTILKSKNIKAEDIDHEEVG